MIKILILIGLISNSVSYAQFQSKVFGGQNVLSSDWMAKRTVALLDGNWMACSASIISDEVALTAAHCIDKGVDYDIGFSVTPERAGTPRRRVHKIIIHPSYDSNMSKKHPADLALLFFKGGLPSGYEKVVLASTKQLPKKKTALTVVGYGASSRNGSDGIGILRKADLKVLSADKKGSQIYLDQSKNQGSCLGDSGGPVFQKNTNDVFIQQGVASWVTSGQNLPGKQVCGNKASYTRVSYYLNWINSHIAVRNN